MGRLGDATWTDVSEGRPLLIVPLGSLEQHGPHLPLDTDSRIATAVAERVASALVDAVVAPTLAYGASGEHAGFPGTLSIGLDALELVIVEIVRSADHFAGVVLVNGHGGNGAALSRAVRRCVAEGRPVACADCGVPSSDAHAGHVETSIMLHLWPGLVRMDRAEVGNVASWTDLAPAVRADGVAAVSDNGVLGDPTSASADAGEAYLVEMADRAVAEVERWRRP